MKIKKLRMSKNLTQLEFSKLLGVERTTVSMWEQNKSNPTIDMLKKIADMFNCSIDDLV